MIFLSCSNNLSPRCPYVFLVIGWIQYRFVAFGINNNKKSLMYLVENKKYRSKS
jgi:hypothetical protein